MKKNEWHDVGAMFIKKIRKSSVVAYKITEWSIPTTGFHVEALFNGEWYIVHKAKSDIEAKKWIEENC